jgi:plastocyanin
MRKSAVALGLSNLTFLALLSSPVVADENHSAEAMFGRGLNTAQPGNVVNHVVIPQDIRVKVGGVVDFTVAGFHDIIVFKPGFTLQDLIDAGGGAYPGFGPLVPPTNQPLYVLRPLPPPPPPPASQACLTAVPPTCIEWAATPTVPASPVAFDEIYYLGIRPAGGPEGTAGTANPSNAVNRGEAVAFLEKGTYLVICNIRPHLVDGMLAYVRVN